MGGLDDGWPVRHPHRKSNPANRMTRTAPAQKHRCMVLIYTVKFA